MEASSNGKARVRASARATVREDYHRQPILSYAEAALIAGVTPSTVQDWVSGGKKGRVPLPACRTRGPFRIDRMELEKFLSRGLK